MNPQDRGCARQIQHFFERSVVNFPENVALVCNEITLTYHQLEERTNQLANYLLSRGLGPNNVIGILLERSIESYVAILAILKIGAAYVPIEIDYPVARINAIFADMPFQAVLISLSQKIREGLNLPTALVIDELREVISQQPTNRPALPSRPNEEEDLCYIIYTSGSTGKPKGVEITHRSICHYVRVVSDIYQMTENDRVYQGFSLAFDASLEELWMAFAKGAALIACTDKGTRSGIGLVEFLAHHKVSFFSTVPTLLATLEGNLPDLRLLILGGEACTTSLVARWRRPGLRIINTYGPTEATVIATYAECQADAEVTIGHPLPGYEAFILDENLQPLNEGELFIGGCGLARGYVNCPETTAKKFVSHPLTNQRLYRTGDLVKKTPSGALQFIGRVDEQIKLRGFRIELNEIEAVMMAHPAINQAVVSLLELEQPILVAYLLPDKEAQFDLEEFRVFLQRSLPHYMMPAAFEMVQQFPLLPSGKVNRKQLPKPTLTTKEYIPPCSPLEKKIASVWETAFQQERVSVAADFFYDLGGHSLLAAKIVSDLRKLPALQHTSLLDVYQNPTIRQLALKFNQQEIPVVNQEKREKRQRNNMPAWKYYLCGIGQLAGCILQYAAEAWQLVTIVLCFMWAAARYSVFSGEFLTVFLLLFMALPIASLILVVSAKWLLLGRVKPGHYRLWSWFYWRWWLVNRLQKNVFSAKGLLGSPLINWYYRLLGAKIGKNCFIGSINIANHDLITIGDNTSINYDARLLGYIVEDGWLKIGAITVGENCFIGARSVVNPGTVIEDNASLDDMSMVPSAAVIPAGQFFSGSPASQALVPPNHISKQSTSHQETTATQTFAYGLLHYMGLFFTMTVYYCCYLAGFTVTSYFYENSPYWLTILLGTALGAIVFLALYCFMIYFCKKIILNKIKPGIYPLKSFYYLRYWIVVKMLDIDEIHAMADSLYLPFFLRCLGAKLGKQVEMGEAPHFSPDLLTIEEGGFTASAVALAWPNIYCGCIAFSPVTVGKRAFVGNMGLLPGGAELGEGGLLGCMSITPPNNKAADANTAWLGSPAVFLPKRELFAGYSERETFQPSKRLYFIRLAIEFLRIIMPSTFSFILLFNMLYILDFLLTNNYSLITAFLVMPAAELAINLSLVAVFVLMKWTILGKLEPLIKPVWSVFIWKYDIIEYLYCFFLNSHFINYILGTPFVAVLFRCLGAKIGKRFFADSNDFTEFDLITIGDDVCINSEVIIQTHLYEDRIFKMSTIKIQEGCNVGCASIVLYDTLMEKNSTLGSFSLLMKGEILPANTVWAGIPAQSVSIGNYELVPEAIDPSMVLECS